MVAAGRRVLMLGVDVGGAAAPVRSACAGASVDKRFVNSDEDPLPVEERAAQFPAPAYILSQEKDYYRKPLLRRADLSPEEMAPRSSPKSCVKSLCSSFFLIRVLLCQARLAGPSVSVGIKNRFLPKPSVQLLSSPYDRISCFHQECPTILFPVLMDIHQNCANQAFC